MRNIPCEFHLILLILIKDIYSKPDIPRMSFPLQTNQKQHNYFIYLSLNLKDIGHIKIY